MKNLIVTLTPEDLQQLTAVCDAALKAAGLQALPAVNRINQAVKAAQDAANQETVKPTANGTPKATATGGNI